jgi:hypothetical protein
MAYTTTSASPVLMDYVDPAVRRAFTLEDNTFRAFMEGKTERTNIRGRRFTITVRPNASYGSIAEGGQLPQPGQPTDVEAKVYYLNQFKTYEINKEVLDQDDDKAMVSLARHPIESTTETFMEDQEVWVFGTGNGSLGVLSDVSGGTTLVLGGDYGSENIRVNARLNAYSSGNSQRTGGGVSVMTVLTNDVDTGTITVDAVPNNLAATDYLTYENSQGNAFHGLPYHISDATTTWLTLSPSTYPQLKSTVHDAAGNPLTPGMIDLVQAKTRKRNGSNAPLNDFALIMHPAQEYVYRSLGYEPGVVQQQVIVDGNGKRTLDLGFSNVMHNGMRFRLSNKCARSDIWGIRFSDWAVEYLKKPGLYQDAHGETIWQKSGSGTPYDAIQGAVMWRGDLVLKGNNTNNGRQRQFRIKNLPYPSGL